MKEFFRRHVIHNFGLKLIALAVASGLWLEVAHDPIAEVALDVPIEFRHIPGSLEIASESVPQAQIRVRGPERVIHRLVPQDVHAEIDLSTARPGERTFDLTAQQVNAPHELDVVQVVPSQFQVTFDTRLSRQVDIRPRVVGKFAEGYRISRITSDPANIGITGPTSRVQSVEVAITDPIDVSGLMDEGTFTTHAYVPDPLVQVMHPGPVHVTVMMERVPAGNGSR
jgi:YbbR domain-containing protein